MTGSSSAKGKFVRAFAVAVGAALLAVPLAATPIATGPDGVNVFAPGGGSLTYRVVMNEHGHNVSTQGFVPGGRTATFTSTIAGSMTLDNLLAPGYTVDSATLDLTVLSSVTAGAVSSFYQCTVGSGTDCTTYTHGHPTISVSGSQATHTDITVVSTSGTTYTWNHQVNSSSPFQLNLATADPDFLTDLSNGQDLSIYWTQTIRLTGSYPHSTGNNRCHNCTLTFHYDGLSRSTTVKASVNGTVTAPPKPPEPPQVSNPVPEPSTGLLLGLGLIATSATLRRKLIRR